MVSVLDKFRNLNRIIKQNNGIWGSLKMLYRMDDVKDGELIGIDRNGNKYYQNNRYFVGRSRWIVYSNKYGLDYDSTHIDPEWHPWLHYQTDKPPSQALKDGDLPKYKWIIDPSENKTGTKQQYYPYSTPQSKIQSWIPSSSSSSNNNDKLNN